MDLITDLGKGVVYAVNKRNREYTEVPVEAAIPQAAQSWQSSGIDLVRTGPKRIVAEKKCDEYGAAEGNPVMRVSISVCVSNHVPGAGEVAAFERKMIARLQGEDLKKATKAAPAGLILDKQSIVSFRLPDASRRSGYRTTFIRTYTRVNGVAIEKLSSATFTPPEGFSKVDNQLHLNVPPEACPKDHSCI